MTTTHKSSWARKIIGSLFIAILASFHANLLFQNSNATLIGFFLVLALSIYYSNKKGDKEEVVHLQYKTLSILSFLLPVSAIIFTLVFTGSAVGEETSEAAKAGAAIGSAIGGGIIIVITFIAGLSLGIVFHLLARKKR